MKKIVVFSSDEDPVVVRKVFGVILDCMLCLACIMKLVVRLSHIDFLGGIDGYWADEWPGAWLVMLQVDIRDWHNYLHTNSNFCYYLLRGLIALESEFSASDREVKSELTGGSPCELAGSC